MTAPVADWKRRPLLLLAMVGLTVAGINHVFHGEYIDGSILLATVAVFVLVMTGLAQRSWPAGRALDALTLWVVASVIWRFLH